MHHHRITIIPPPFPLFLHLPLLSYLFLPFFLLLTLPFLQPPTNLQIPHNHTSISSNSFSLSALTSFS